MRVRVRVRMSGRRRVMLVMHRDRPGNVRHREGTRRGALDQRRRRRRRAGPRQVPSGGGKAEVDNRSSSFSPAAAPEAEAGARLGAVGCGGDVVVNVKLRRPPSRRLMTSSGLSISLSPPLLLLLLFPPFRDDPSTLLCFPHPLDARTRWRVCDRVAILSVSHAVEASGKNERPHETERNVGVRCRQSRKEKGGTTFIGRYEDGGAGGASSSSRRAAVRCRCECGGGERMREGRPSSSSIIIQPSCHASTSTHRSTMQPISNLARPPPPSLLTTPGNVCRPVQPRAKIKCETQDGHRGEKATPMDGM